MDTPDILIIAQRRVCEMDKLLTEIAQYLEVKQWTDAAVTWGRVVSAARGVSDLEWMMADVLRNKSDTAKGGE